MKERKQLKPLLYTSLLGQSLLESYRMFADWIFILKNAAVDIGFFIIFAVTYTFYFNPKIMEIQSSLTTLMSEMSANIPSDSSMPTQEALIALSSQKESFTQAFGRLAFLFFLLLIFIYALWCIFQGTSWWLAHRKLRHNVGWYKSEQRFSALSLIWAAIFLVLYIIIVKISALLTVGSIELVSVELLARMLGVALLIVLYFASISYSLLDIKLKEALKETFVIGIKKAAVAIPAFLLIIIKFYVLYGLIMLLGLELVPKVVLGLIFFLPLTAWARLFMGVVVEKAPNKK